MEMIKHLTTALVENGWGVEIPLTLVFEAANPLAVVLEFEDPTTGIVPWLVDRALLTEGLEGAAGSGDLQIWPVDSYKDRVYMCLSSDEGEAVVTVSAHEIRTFLEGVEKLLPLGQEDEIVRAQLDGWLEDLLSVGE